jgi:hypothetical protein
MAPHTPLRSSRPWEKHKEDREDRNHTAIPAIADAPSARHAEKRFTSA